MQNNLRALELWRVEPAPRPGLQDGPEGRRDDGEEAARARHDGGDNEYCISPNPTTRQVLQHHTIGAARLSRAKIPRIDNDDVNAVQARQRATID